MEFVLMFQLGTLRVEGQGNSTYLDFCGDRALGYKRQVVNTYLVPEVQ